MNMVDRNIIRELHVAFGGTAYQLKFDLIRNRKLKPKRRLEEYPMKSHVNIPELQHLASIIHSEKAS
jgi:hypothetical protein